MREFMRQFFIGDQRGIADQTVDKGASTRERINDMHIFITNAAPELGTQNMIGAMQNKIDNFNWRIGNAQTFRYFGKSRFEEFFIKFNHDLLARGGIINACYAVTDAGIKAIHPA